MKSLNEHLYNWNTNNYNIEAFWSLRRYVCAWGLESEQSSHDWSQNSSVYQFFSARLAFISKFPPGTREHTFWRSVAWLYMSSVISFIWHKSAIMYLFVIWRWWQMTYITWWLWVNGCLWKRIDLRNTKKFVFNPKN